MGEAWQQIATAAEVAIAVRGVTKVFPRTEARADTLKERLISTLTIRQRDDLLLALDGFDLEVRAGETLGLIGPNGSGKSTLLKLIAGISEPTQGTVEVHGRVLGLIELGAGFHPELTGEENVRLQGAIYGLTAEEVEAAMEPILEFAGLQDFRSMAVKHYSSGMFVRLGFAIGMHARPDVLLVDEVLAVGDQAFQERCIGAIGELRRRGVTIVFVTHFPEQAERVCERMVWMEKGRVRQVGPAMEVLTAWRDDLIAGKYGESGGALDARVTSVGLPGRFGLGGARIERVRVRDKAGQPRWHYGVGEPFRIEIDYSAQPEVEAFDCTMPLESTADGTILMLWRAEREFGVIRPGPEGRGRIVLELDDPPLLAGKYRLTVALSKPGSPYEHYDVLYRLFELTFGYDSEGEGAWESAAPLLVRGRIEV